METCAVARRMSALILVSTVSVIGMPLPAGAAGEEAVEGAWHRALTFNGRPLSQFLGAATPRRAAFPLAAFLRQESGLILGVALNAEGQPLADHAVALRSLSERATAPPVVATTTTDATGGFSFPGFRQGRYMVNLRAGEQVIATTGPVSLAEEGMTFVQVGGMAVGQSPTEERKGKGALFWTAVGAGVGGGLGLGMCLPHDPDPSNLCWVAAGEMTGRVNLRQRGLLLC